MAQRTPAELRAQFQTIASTTAVHGITKEYMRDVLIDATDSTVTVLPTVAAARAQGAADTAGAAISIPSRGTFVWNASSTATDTGREDTRAIQITGVAVGRYELTGSAVSALLPNGESVTAGRIATAPDSVVLDGVLRPRIYRPNPGILTTARRTDGRLSGLDIVPNGRYDSRAYPTSWSPSAINAASQFVRMTVGTGYPDPFGGYNAVQLLETATTGAHGVALDLTNGGGLAIPAAGPYLVEYAVKPIGSITSLSTYGVFLGGSSYEFVGNVDVSTVIGPDIGFSGIENQTIERPRVYAMRNGWFLVRQPYRFTRANGSWFIFSSTGAGNTANGFYFLGVSVDRVRQATPIETWSSPAAIANQPSVELARHCPLDTWAITTESAQSGAYLEDTTAPDIAIVDGTPITLTIVGECTSTEALSGDLVLWRGQDAPGTTYLEIGLTTSSGSVYHYVRQVVSGGATVTSLSPTTVAHVPTARTVVLNGTTAQWYRDNRADGTAAAFALSAMTCARARIGCNSGTGYWQTVAFEPRGSALTSQQVRAIHEELLQAHYGFGSEPWRIIALFGQSNSDDAGSATELLSIIGPKTRVWMPANLVRGSALTTSPTSGLRPVYECNALEVPNVLHGLPIDIQYGLKYGMARELGRRKVVICHCTQGGEGWDTWASNTTKYSNWIARIQATAALVSNNAADFVYSHFVSMLGEGNWGNWGGAPGAEPEWMRAMVADTIGSARTALGNANMVHVLCYLSEDTQTAGTTLAAINDGFDLRVAEDNGRTLPVSTNTLAVGSDGTHFSMRARLEIGRRAANQVIASWGIPVGA